MIITQLLIIVYRNQPIAVIRLSKKQVLWPLRMVYGKQEVIDPDNVAIRGMLVIIPPEIVPFDCQDNVLIENQFEIPQKFRCIITRKRMLFVINIVIVITEGHDSQLFNR